MKTHRQKIKWSNENKRERQTMIYESLHMVPKIEQRTPQKPDMWDHESRTRTGILS